MIPRSSLSLDAGLQILVRWVILTVASFAAYLVLPGIRIEGNAIATMLFVTMLLGFINAIVGPLLAQVSFGSLVRTSAVLLFAANALILWLAVEIARTIFRVGIIIDGFVWAFLGAIIISVLSEVLTKFLPPDRVAQAMLTRDPDAPPLTPGLVARRLLAVLAMVVSLVLTVASLTGIVNLWMIRAPVIEGVVTWLGRVEPVLETADNTLVRATAGLQRTRGYVERVENTVVRLGTNIADNRIILTVISNTVGTQLVQSVVEVATTVSTFAEAIRATNNALEAIDALPFASAPTLPEEVSAIVDRVADLRSEAQDLYDRVTTLQAELVGGAVGEITTRTQRIDRAIAEIEALTMRYNQRVVQARQAVAIAKVQAPTWITFGVIGASLALAWFAFSQAVVFLYAWSLAGFRPLFRGVPVGYSPDGR